MRVVVFSAIALLILVPLGRFLYMVVPATGVLSDFSTVAVDQCRAIESAPGPEDIQIDHSTGIAYISAAQRRGRTDGHLDGMYTLDLNDPDAKPRLMERDGPSDFVPHGISLLEEEQLLFVISHPSTGHTVEVFKIEENRLAHLRTITSELFIEPNDIVAFKPDTFYVSNFQNARDGIGLTLERYLGLPVTNIVQFADGQASIAVDGLVSANGVNISKDGSELYVAELLAQKMNIFQRDPATGKLGKRQRFSIGTAADNIDVGSDGDLYIATHPNLLAFAAHAEDENATSPSQIIRINPSTQAQETVFMSIDGEFNGSSVGAFWEGNLLLGNVHDPQIMRCSL